jgi:hypothetical protein
MLFAPVDGGFLHQSSVEDGTGQSPQQPATVLALWQPEVDYRPDVLHDGKMIAGIRGRLYLLFDDLSGTFYADGTLVVEMQGETRGSKGQPVVLDKWEIDRETLRKWRRRDIVGDGYSLWLPWESYRPDGTCIQMKVRFDQPGRPPLCTESSPFAVERPRSGF